MYRLLFLFHDYKDFLPMYHNDPSVTEIISVFLMKSHVKEKKKRKNSKCNRGWVKKVKRKGMIGTKK